MFASPSKKICHPHHDHQVVDVTDEASALGYRASVTVSKLLWTTVLWHYPGCTDPDPHLFLRTILKDLKSRVATARHSIIQEVSWEVALPSLWVPRVALKAQIHGVPQEANPNIRIMLLVEARQDAGLDDTSTNPPKSPLPLPSQVITRLALRLMALSDVARHEDWPQLDRLYECTEQLISAHPLAIQIRNALHRFAPTPPSGDKNRHRQQVLTDVSELLSNIIEFADPEHATVLRSILAEVEGLRSPISDLLQFLKELILFAALLPDTDPSRVFENPYQQLLILHSDILSQHKTGSTSIMRADMSSLASHLHALAACTSCEQHHTLVRFDDEFRRLRSPQKPLPLGELSHPPKKEWQ